MAEKIETVLVATSLAQASDPVVRAGYDAARRAGAALHLFHAYPLPIAYYGTPLGMTAVHPEALESEKSRCEMMLAEQLRRLEIPRRAVAGTAIEIGAPHRMLLEIAGELAPDLLVVGAAEEHAALAPFLGSTADRVLRKSTVPVLVVRAPLVLPPARVLAPVDLSELAEDSLRRGLAILHQLAGGEGLAVEALFVLSPVDREGSVHFKPEQVDRFAREELDLFLGRIAAAGEEATRVTGEVRAGLPRQEIVRELEEHPADLVVIGTHGRSGFERFLLGSVAADIARHAPSNVLVIPPAVARHGAPEG